MNIFEGHFYSTAFAVRDERAFHDDPDMEVFRQHFDMFSGVEGTLHVHCFTHKTGAPGTRLRVMRPAILSLTADAVLLAGHPVCCQRPFALCRGRFV